MLSIIGNKLKTSKDLTVVVPRNLYLSGEELVGHVEFTPKKSVHLSFAKIYFCGAEFCAWTERVAMRTGAPPTAGDLQLFKKEQILVHERTRFNPGSHTWNFRFVVPRNIPPSCIYKRGQACVAYFLKVKACTGFGHFDLITLFPVMIGQLWIPIQPVTIHNTENTGGGERIRMQALCSHSVAKCDERVNCHIQFNNGSHKTIDGIRVKLKQVWECSEVFHHKNTVLKLECRDGFPVNRGQQTRDVSFTIPANLAVQPTVSNAQLFKCTYYIGVYLVVKFGGIMSSERVVCRLPIIISNLPRDPIDNPLPAPLQHLSSNNNINHNSNNNINTNNSSVSSNVNNAMEEMLANFQDGLAFGGDEIVRSRSESSGSGRVARESSSSSGSRESGGDSSLPHSYSDGYLADAPVIPSAPYNPFTNPVEEGSPPPRHENAEYSENKPAAECVICFDGPKNMLLLPCAHIATCVSCTAQIMRSTKTCPVCRAKVTQVLRTYQV